MVKQIKNILIIPFKLLAKLKVWQRFIIVLITLFLIISPIGLYFTALNIRHTLLNLYQNKGIAITQAISKSSNQIIFNSPPEMIQSMIDSYVNIKGVAYLLVVNDQKEIIAHTFVPTIPPIFKTYLSSHIHEDHLLENMEEKAIINEIKIPKIGEVFDIKYPIFGGVGGHVHLGLHKSLIKLQVRNAVIREIIMLVSLLTISMIILSVFIKYFSQDIKSLLEGVKKVTNGDYDIQIKVRDKNEIALLANAFNSMVFNLKNSLRELSDVKYALDKSAIIIITNLEGNITYVNDKFCEISGYSSQELIGKNHLILNHNCYDNQCIENQFFERICKKINQGKIWRGEIKHQAKKGHYYWTDTVIVPFLDYTGKPFQYLSIKTEITARKEFENALERKVKERTQQLSKANHEINQLNEILKSDNIRLSSELNLLRQMQQMILPNPEELKAVKNLDIAGFMQPADEVGGDYYDVLEHEGVVTIGIGDVTGHGLESGILMVMTQTAVLTLKLLKESDPVNFLDILNRTIYHNVKRMNSDRNLTLAILNYSQQKLVISGQHEETIVVKSNGEIERIDTMDLGLPLGFDDDITDFIDHRIVNLDSGDGIVLYTDGITEAFNEQKEQYGIEKLCEIISINWQYSAAEIQQAVIADVILYMGSEKQFDDLTLLVIKQK